MVQMAFIHAFVVFCVPLRIKMARLALEPCLLRSEKSKLGCRNRINSPEAQTLTLSKDSLF